MSLKVYAISKDKYYYRIGDSPETKDWYVRTEETGEVLNTINKGDEVEINYTKDEVGKRLLNSVKVVKKAIQSSPAQIDNKWRKPEELRRDETLRSVCLGIQAMPGQFGDVNALVSAICFAYDKLLVKVK